MERTDHTLITVETVVRKPVDLVWESWTEPVHIQNWNNASDDWHTPFAQNDLRPGGRFLSRMEARDGRTGFDFSGVYDVVMLHELIEYTLDDDRKVRITFDGQGDETRVVETFEAEHEYPSDYQRQGWQAILDHFAKYTESIVID